jgi:pimeloyl-ACP methyl ester carboxylesterase
MLRYGMVRTRRQTAVSYVALGPDGAGSAPLLLVHPINLRKECWLDVMRLLAGDRLCVAVDLTGHGESGDGDGFSLEGWVADCSDVLAELDIGRCHVAGGSLGGTIAFCLAGELPEQVLSVTAMGSSLRDEPDPSGQSAPDVAAMLDTRSVDELFARLAVEALAPGAPAELVTTVRLLTNTHGETVVRGILSASQAADATQWVPAVRCPVLVLTGEFDATDAPDAGQVMASSVGGRHELIPDVGHLLMLEDAAGVLKRLVPHLESTEAKMAAR